SGSRQPGFLRLTQERGRPLKWTGAQASSLACLRVRAAKIPRGTLALQSLELKLRTKALAIFQRGEEGLDHLRLQKVAIELDQLVQPEVVTVEVPVRRVVRVPSQVSEVLHLHDPAVQLPRLERGILRNSQQRPAPRCRICSRCGTTELGNCRRSFRRIGRGH